MKQITVLILLALPGMGQTLKVESVANPAGNGSLQPNWSVAHDGSPLLSWIEASKDGSYALRYAVRSGTGWSEARTVVAHRRFFRHPAEVPEVISLNDGTLLAHWIEMPNESSEAEFVYVSSSRDGVKWTTPVMANKDRSQVQHGLASMVATGNREASLVWLETPKGEDGPGYLMRTVVNGEGVATKEERLDSDVCSCCPTSIVNTSRGLLVAYRDHTAEDIRDISVLRFENAAWSSSKNLSPDKWKINACPTNAAAAAAKGDQVAIAWFTGAQDKPRTQIAFSSDAGSTFGKPVVVSTGHAFGYVSIALDEDGGAFVSWLEQGGDNGRVLVRQVTKAGVVGPVIEVAQGARQRLGYPKLFRAANQTWIAWGDSKADAKIQTARLMK